MFGRNRIDRKRGERMRGNVSDRTVDAPKRSMGANIYVKRNLFFIGVSVIPLFNWLAKKWKNRKGKQGRSI